MLTTQLDKENVTMAFEAPLCSLSHSLLHLHLQQSSPLNYFIHFSLAFQYTLNTYVHIPQKLLLDSMCLKLVTFSVC